MTGKDAFNLISELGKLFDIVRVIDTAAKRIVKINEDGSISLTNETCHKIWHRDQVCDNCVSDKACRQKRRLEKFEVSKGDIYHVICFPLEIGDRTFSLETVSLMENNVLAEAYDDKKFARLMSDLQEQLYNDPLTGALNRRYFEEHYNEINSSAAMAIVDIDDFKEINDTYGHLTGDVALNSIVKQIQINTRNSDVIVRFGGDEFLIAFSSIPRDVFLGKMDAIRQSIAKIRIPDAPELSLSVSIGCAYDSSSKGAAFEEADKQLYIAKLRKNAVAFENEFTSSNQDGTVGIYSLNDERADCTVLSSHRREISIIKRQNAVITGLSGSLDYACYISRKDKEVICFQTGDRLRKHMDKIDSSLSYTEKMKRFFADIVHKDDLERLREATKKERVVSELRNNSIYFHDFRIVSEGEILYYRIKFVQDRNDPDGILFGLININSKKREEKRRTEEDILRRMMKIIGKLDDDAILVYAIDVETGKYKTLFNDEEYVRRLNFPKTGKENFFESSMKLCRPIVYEPDWILLTEYLNLDRIVREIEEKGASELEYRLMVDGTPAWFRLRTVFADNEDRSSLLACVFAVDKLHRTDGERLSYNAFLEKYTAVFRVDLDNDILHIIKSGPKTKAFLEDTELERMGYSERLRLFAERNVLEDDLSRITEAISIDNIRRKLSENRTFTETFRVPDAEGFRYYEVSATRLNSDKAVHECIIGIKDNNEEILSTAASGKILDEYYSTYVVNTKTGNYRCIHKIGGFGADWGMSGKYDEIMACEEEFTNPEDWGILNAIGSADRLKQYVKDGYPDEIVYRTTDEQEPWEKCIVKKLDEHDGEPVNILVAFGPVEDARSDELNYQQKQREIHLILRQCINLMNSGADPETSVNAMLSVVGGYYKSARAYVCSVDENLETIDVVCEWETSKQEHDENFIIKEITFKRELTEKLKMDGEVSVYSEDGKRCLVAAVPFIDNGSLTGFVALADIGRESRDFSLLRFLGTFIYGEILRKKRKEIENAEKLAVVSALASDYDEVLYITLKESEFDDISEIYRISPVMEKAVPGWKCEKQFSHRLDILRETVVHPEDKKLFKNASTRDNVVNALENGTSYIINFRACIGEALKHYQLKFVADKDEKGNLKGIVAGLHNTDEEINDERERQKQLEQIVRERTGEILEKNEKLNRINEEIFDLFGQITEARDIESGEHIKRVKDFTYILAEQVMNDLPEYGLTEKKVKLISAASSLHDVGKIMIPDEILLKNSSLTPAEFEIMKTHCAKGCKIIEKAPSDWNDEYINTSLEICRWHHEKYDGNGYPDGLVGDEIPISAQIVAVADCFDALINKRSYKDAYERKTALNMILNDECGAFSPKLMNSLRNCSHRFIEQEKKNGLQ